MGRLPELLLYLLCLFAGEETRNRIDRNRDADDSGIWAAVR